MAVTFTPKSGTVVTIGGSASTGPFPRYSISREEILAGDGTYLNTKFNINVTGTTVISSSTDITTKGARQSAIQEKASTHLQFNRGFPTHGVGKLEISPYGGLANTLVFDDAKLVSLELPEQGEESAGVQYLEYSFAFEAYKHDEVDYPTWNLSTVEDSWDLSVNEGQITFADNNLSSTPIKTYTLTHTVSATGLKKFDSDSVATDGEAWRQAVQWVATRLVDDPNTAIDTDIVGQTAVTNFNPFYMDKNSTDIGFDLVSDSYTHYNHVRSVSSDMAGGSYAVTDTWITSNSTTTATHEIDVSYETSSDASANTVTVTGTITGFDNTASSINTTDRYNNARGELDDTLSKAFIWAGTVYTYSGGSGSLRNVELNKSIGHNKAAGTITYSVTYDDLVVSVANAVSESINVTYDNEDGANQTIAIIPVIGKTDGPVIQDMNTTPEKTINVTVDLVMNKSYRTSKPDGTSVANTYKPSSNVFQQSKTESWSPTTGTYNLSIEWVYV
tara:strand:- start:1120 stop:2628 length:1509 start_codon:yes stop_codon:yes gene_type:complete